MKILVIEDRILIQELLRFNLEKEGYIVVTSDNGAEGLALVKSEKPDLMSSVLDGFEVYKILRAKKENSSIPIIIMSARNDIADQIMGFELEADEYITKPFNPKDLIARIKARLERRAG